MRHHVASDFAWPKLRPVQEQAIGPVLDGDNTIILAPTAGGKTEAALLPVISMVHTERWQGLSVLYLSPIRALLDDQHPRLERMFGWIGATAAVWHGGIKASAKKRLRREPPACLLTTPESLEGILCSRVADARVLLAGVRVVVIDEIHGFAGGDRGWHMLAILHRVAVLTGRDLQRIGLSATVGNVDELRDWFCRGSKRPRRTVAPAPESKADAEVVLDAVGDLAGAVRILERLHRGEKRLVFCDSRIQAERLGVALRSSGLQTFVTHSSLSAEERTYAERGFAETSAATMVATSALELGIDIGDLSRVVQMDAPARVASFLQRMGRTGRRPGAHPNCLFLTTSDAALLRGAAIIDLWQQGYVESAQCPAAPWNILGQQALALALQGRGPATEEHRSVLASVAELFGLERAGVATLLESMLAEGWLAEADGHVIPGDRAEAELGRRNFLDLLSVFSTPPLFDVIHGRRSLGQVHELTFAHRRQDEPTTLVLAGRPWLVTRLDRRRRKAYVEPAKKGRAPRWLGVGAAVAPELAAAVREILLDPQRVERYASRRAKEALARLAEEHAFLAPSGPTLHIHPDQRWELWTFAGTAVNAELAGRLGLEGHACTSQALAISGQAGTADGLGTAWSAIGEQTPDPRPRGSVQEAEFEQLLPPPLRLDLAAGRAADPDALRRLLQQDLQVVLEL